MVVKKSIYEISKSYFAAQNEGIELLRKAKSSWKLTEWIISHSSLSGSSKLVAAAIASYYNRNLGYAYPTSIYICARTGLSRASFSRAIEEMKLSGEWLILSMRMSASNIKTTNRYFPLAPLQYDQVKNLEKFISDFPDSAKGIYPSNVASLWKPSSPAFWVKGNKNYDEDVNRIQTVLSSQKVNSKRHELNYQLTNFYYSLPVKTQKDIYHTWARKTAYSLGLNDAS